MATCRSGPINWRLAAVLVVLLSGHRDGNAQGTAAPVAAAPPAAAPVSAAPASAVPDAAAVCQSCHGAFGRPDNLDYPIIGGQNASYLASALRAYRAGQRTGETADLMAPFAKPLDDRTIDELAAFFATLRSLR